MNARWVRVSCELVMEVRFWGSGALALASGPIW